MADINKSKDKNKLLENFLECCKAVEKKFGKKPLIYTSNSAVKDFFKKDSIHINIGLLLMKMIKLLLKRFKKKEVIYCIKRIWSFINLLNMVKLPEWKLKRKKKLISMS